MKNRQVAKAFGRVLRALRQKEGISQVDLALVAKLDRTYPSLLERGKRVPSLTIILKIAKGVKLTPETLVKRTVAELES